eukprot:TRINITY_DN14151_c0_g1_i1.p1 TRINITY_DN14151_c0_g1~~TRINITY_DN14151_c0_g1_i1.p1  ORF type:complete len:166 (-),score=87.58 TRINITY_DN14151_c0_g1_i1:66-563(-)
MSETELRSVLDQVVDRVIKKLDKKTFLESMPKTIDQEFLSSMHSRLLSVVRRKLSQLVEDKITEEQLGDKLSQLDKIVAGTPHPTSHQAWRPVAGADTLSVGGQDLKVSLREKEELGLVLQQLNSEVEQLEEKMVEEGNRMAKNMATINRGEQVLEGFATKMGEM